jgi:hypothetical protein
LLVLIVFLTTIALALVIGVFLATTLVLRPWVSTTTMTTFRFLVFGIGFYSPLLAALIALATVAMWTMSLSVGLPLILVLLG